MKIYTCYRNTYGSSDAVRTRIIDNDHDDDDEETKNKLQAKNNGSMRSNNSHNTLLPSLTANMAMT